MRYVSSAALAGLGLLIATTAHAQSAGEVVRIGILNDQAGLYADFGGRTSVDAARMAAEDFGGTVLGKRIEIISSDHQNKPDVASGIARRWFEVDDVGAIAELTNSAIALAVQQIAMERGKITLATGPATTRLTNESCSPTGFHWAFDTYSQAVGTARAVVATGGKSWFILAADYAFGHQMATDLARVVKANGGTVAGVVNHPINSPDFGLIPAAGAGIEGPGGRPRQCGRRYGQLGQAGRRVSSHRRRPEVGRPCGRPDRCARARPASRNGLVFTTAFYWDRDDASRAWSKRFFERTGRMPGMVQAGTYSAVLHYLKAMKAAGTTDGKAVAAKMRELPVDDFFAKGRVREDGRMMHDMYLVEVKTPSKSKAPWDYYKVLRQIPAEDAAQPLARANAR